MKRRTLLWSFLVACPIVLGLRVFQLAKTLDPASGFPYASYGTGYTITMVLLAVFCIAVLLLSRFFISEVNAACRPKAKNPALGVCAVLTAAGMVADSVTYYRMASETKFTAIQTALAVLTVVAAILMLCTAYAFFVGRPLSAGVSISLVGWALLRLFILYITKYNGMANASENIFDVLALAFVMMFLLYMAHLHVGSDTARSAGWIMGFGLNGALFCGLTALLRTAMRLTPLSGTVEKSVVSCYANLGFFCFILVYLFAMSGRAAEAVADDKEESEDAYSSMVANPGHFVTVSVPEAEEQPDGEASGEEDFFRNYGKDDTIDDILRRTMGDAPAEAEKEPQTPAPTPTDDSVAAKENDQ